MRHLLLIPILSLWLAGQAFAADIETTTPSAPTRLWRGIQSGPAVGGSMVIHTEAGWNELWNQIGRGAPLPFFDPEQDVAIAIFLGQRPTAGYDIHMAGTESRDGFLHVIYEEISPPAGAPVPQILTTPYLLFIIPRPDLPLLVHEAGDEEGIGGPEP